MLDLTAVFLIVGLLLGGLRFAQSADSGQPGQSVLAQASGQGVLGVVAAMIGVSYATAIILNNPDFVGIDVSFDLVRTVLIKVLPSIVLGLLAGIAVRLGVRDMNVNFLAIGAVFFVLPFLLTQGAGFLKNFNKVKVAWFEAEIKSTQDRSPIQIRLQTLEDRSQTGFSLLSPSAIQSLVQEASDFRSILRARSATSGSGKEAEFSTSAGPTSDLGQQFYDDYIVRIVDCIPQGEVQTLSSEEGIREQLESVAIAGDNMLRAAMAERRQKPDKIAFEEVWNGFVNAAHQAASKLSSMKKQQANATSACMNPASGTASKADSGIASMALPHLLVARLFRRAGFDNRALTVLDSAEDYLRTQSDDTGTASEWTRVLIERGELRYALGIADWHEDWAKAIDQREQLLSRVAYRFQKQLAKSCGNEPHHAFFASIARQQLEVAQLQNRLVFALVEDQNGRRTVAADPSLMDQIVSAARKNYNRIQYLSMLSGCVPEEKQEIEAVSCIDVVYPDTYALALIAYSRQNNVADLDDLSVKIHSLLQQALDNAQTTCPKEKNFEKIIAQHLRTSRQVLLH